MEQVQLFDIRIWPVQGTVAFKFSVMFLEKPRASLVCLKIDLITTSTSYLGFFWHESKPCLVLRTRFLMTWQSNAKTNYNFIFYISFSILKNLNLLLGYNKSCYCSVLFVIYSAATVSGVIQTKSTNHKTCIDVSTVSEQVRISLFCFRHFMGWRMILKSIVSVLLLWLTLSGWHQ